MRKPSRLLRGVLAGALAFGLTPMVAFADSSVTSLPSVVETLGEQQQQRWNAVKETGDLSKLTDRDAYNYEEGIAALSASPYAYTPARFDLRDEGVVTPVKFQNPWGTCWGFAAIAAAETSILSELGTTYETTGLDLSELQLAWFAQTALPEDGFSQGGEGCYAVDTTRPSNRLDTGGELFTATSIFSSGIGPVTEEMVPYRNAEGITVNMQDGTPIHYSTEGDWSVPEEMRFTQVFELEESSILPAPASRDANGLYAYNESGTIAIKHELMEGRAVQVAFAADTSHPGQTDPAQYINTDTWAHYTYDTSARATHAVTIVGWDDDYSAQNFLEGHRPPADGAWIVKNSWGSISEEFPNGNPDGWGVEGEGYFYLSYYDASMQEVETLDFDTKSSQGDSEFYYVDAYDYMPSDGVNVSPSENPVSMANVFTAEDDQALETVSVETATPETSATFDIYILNDNPSSPVDGDLVSTAAETYRYGGYHRTDLEKPVTLKKGQQFSIVVTLRTASGTYQMLTESKLNEAGAHYVRESLGIDVSSYAKGVINEGESYIGDSEGWADWKIVSDTLKAENPEGTYLDFDNFAIKAYSNPLDDSDDPAKPYDDVHEGEWYVDAVGYVINEGIMTGYGNGLFGPNDTMLRQDVACMLFKWLEPDKAAAYNDPEAIAASKNETYLPDVENGAYYTAAINWCVAEGIMTGHEGENPYFGVNENITREQFAKVLYEATGQQGAGIINGDFPDKDEVSPWAVTYMAWATGKEIITGIDGCLAPQLTATRAQVATMVMRASE